MTRRIAAALVLLTLGLVVPSGAVSAAASRPSAGTTAPKASPLAQAHAHNDYEHARPLQDALDHGFTSVEADVWLVGGELLVGHDVTELVPGRTLQSLYLDPLVQRVREHGGEVYSGHDEPLQLLIDIKNTGAATYTQLDQVLSQYRRILTRYAGKRMVERAVSVVVSGDRPRALMEAQKVRLASYDGRLTDLGSGAPASFVPLISSNWNSTFTWQGVGEMPADQRAALHRISETAHANGQRVRFWATPDVPGAAREAVWAELLAAGVDHVNTDDLPGLRAYLLAQHARAAA